MISSGGGRQRGRSHAYGGGTGGRCRQKNAWPMVLLGVARFSLGERKGLPPGSTTDDLQSPNRRETSPRPTPRRARAPFFPARSPLGARSFFLFPGAAALLLIRLAVLSPRESLVCGRWPAANGEGGESAAHFPRLQRTDGQVGRSETRRKPERGRRRSARTRAETRRREARDGAESGGRASGSAAGEGGEARRRGRGCVVLIGQRDETTTKSPARRRREGKGRGRRRHQRRRCRADQLEERGEKRGGHTKTQSADLQTLSQIDHHQPAGGGRRAVRADLSCCCRCLVARLSRAEDATRGAWRRL